ncbi:MAG: prepilin-type N-terminal cleavage/methylation domain-containing protein [Campylobacterales bacterium]
MKRPAFTLMELLISIVLISMLALFLYGALGGTRASNATMHKHARAEALRLKIYELLYRDCVESYDAATLATSDKHYQVLQLQTKNSLYGIAAPYVTYFVHAETLQLIRLEAPIKITLPVPYEARERVHVDVIDENVTDFNFYTAQEGEEQTEVQKSPADGNKTSPEPEAGERSISTHLLYLNTKNREHPMLIELAF